MEALLGASQANPSCGSVPDLQGRLRDLLGSRATETRVEHTSVTFEIRATAVFDIRIAESGGEGGALENNVSNIDPVLGGAQPAAAAPGGGGGGDAYANGTAGSQPTRRVNAIDALINQPVDDPALQTAIVRHIIASLSAVDGSNWTVRQVSRGEQGWTFTYICKDSRRAWGRHASKNPAKTAIGEWSDMAGQDPVHLARPAFDCRGSVKIAFAKSAKIIEVKYEHTPMHKTVAQLIELLAPPPLAPIVKTPAKKVPKPRTPRPPKARTGGENGVLGAEGESQPKRRRKKDSLAPDGTAGDGSAQPKKRRKKKDSQATPGGTVLPPEMPGALPVGNGSARQLYNTQPGTAQANGSGSYPEGLVGSANDGAVVGNDDEVHAHSMLNLPPGEAARRREVAIGLLRESGIDPKSLSAEQFSILANQSPELQQDSLAMLRKYGAERLRIVHPNKEGSSSGQSTPNAQGTPVPAEASLPKKARKKKSAAADEGEAAESLGTSHKGRMCDNCRGKKYKGKCDKKRPSCNMCLAEGEACVYPILKRQRKSEAAPVEAPAPAVEPDAAHDGPEDPGSRGFHTAQVNHQVHDAVDHSASEPVQEQYDHHAHQTAHEPVSDHHQVPETPSDAFNYTQDMYQHPSGLTFPRPGAASTTELTHTTSSSAAMGGYMSNSISEAPNATLHSYDDYSQPAAAPQATSGYAEQHTAPSSFGHTRSGSSGAQATSSRHILQTSQAAGSGMSGSGLDAQNTWPSVNTNPTRPTPAARTSPRQSRTKRPAPASQYDDPRQQEQQQQVSSAANQSASRSTPPVRNSPVQVAAQPARAKARQASQAQSHAPVNSMLAGRKPLPQSAQPVADSSGYASATATAQQPSSAQTYNTYNQYQTETSQTDGSSDRTAYQPYSHTHTTSQPATYSSFDEYNSARAAANTASSTLSAQASQNVASSYPSNSAATARLSQWGTSTTTPQTGHSRGYMSAPSATETSSYNTTSTTPQQQQSLQGLNLRPQSQTQTRSSSNTYTQQPQQQQQRQQQQQQQGYTGYMTQMQQPQQHTATSSQQQQGWGYGFGTTSSSSGYNLTSGGGAAASSHGHGSSHTAQQQQQHRSLHHGALEHDASLYDLLRRNPAG